MDDHRPERPTALRICLQLHLLWLALGALTVVLTAVLRDDLVLSWARGHRSAVDVLERQGLDCLIEEQPIAVPQFFPVAAVLFVTMAMLVAVLMVFFRRRPPLGARVPAVLVVMTAVATISGIRVEPPQVFVVLGALARRGGRDPGDDVPPAHQRVPARHPRADLRRLSHPARVTLPGGPARPGTLRPGTVVRGRVYRWS